MNIVISQSMLFPWVGLLEQVRLADVFVHYDDVQFSKGSFVNRVQIKTPQGMRWMTVPLVDLHLGQKINEVQVPPSEQWRDTHLALLESSLANAPFRRDALELVEGLYAVDYRNIGALARASLMALVKYFGLDSHCRFIDVESLDIPGSSSDRVLRVVKSLDGDTYITGHGASRYLDHELFERSGVAVEYMAYNCTPYPQAHGDFTPYVSALDLVANCGKLGLESIKSATTDWRSFKNEPA
ncbi:WbqC family protein [Pseudomonas agarici]|uniref:WbqC family protein n=1 Tax=Pseudomonas agarici TaxID=46677 RepID=UPI0002F791EE|nr:WbqC family protein [Pseudomonas agarici]NWB90771.1 WbqC family protein [Pseudomonas agarici]NWC08591.1 WbqC family protein [Pseudomonas agarici]SEL25607.1 WbqC-like protein family protein [Pseudomonas agarici]